MKFINKIAILQKVLVELKSAVSGRPDRAGINSTINSEYTGKLDFTWRKYYGT